MFQEKQNFEKAKKTRIIFHDPNYSKNSWLEVKCCKNLAVDDSVWS